MNIQDRYLAAMNKVCKWRVVFTGRMVGTQPKTPQVAGMNDFFEKWIILRAESNALARLLVDKGVFTLEEFQTQLIEEAKWLDRQFELQFPGIRSSDDGMVFFDADKVAQTMEGWPP